MEVLDQPSGNHPPFALLGPRMEVLEAPLLPPNHRVAPAARFPLSNLACPEALRRAGPGLGVAGALTEEACGWNKAGGE